MSQNLIDFGTEPIDFAPVRVRSLRNMICRPLGCTPRPVAIGEVIDISGTTLRELGSEDIEVLGPVPAALEYAI